MPLEKLGSNVFSGMFSLATAYKVFTSEGGILLMNPGKRFEENLIAFMKLVEAAKNYPCIKKVWVEFLGEQTDAVTERVE